MFLRSRWPGTLALVVVAPLALLTRGSAVSVDPRQPAVVDYASWPLGPDGDIPRALYSTHGQLWSVSGDFLHQGIDISACPREPVFAVEAGIVVYSTFDKSNVNSESKEVIVSRGGDLLHGMRYLHLGASVVDVGDEVRRDQLIGTVVNWNAFCSYDHLHLQVVKCADGASSAWSVLSAEDAGNPVCQFDPATDKELPACAGLPSIHSAQPERLLFFENESDKELEPTDLSGKIDVVASFRDQCFTEKPSCGSSSSGCPVASSFDVAPCKIQLTIKKLDSSGAVAESESFEPIFFDREISGSDQTALAPVLYHSTSEGTYSSRDLRFVATHGARHSEDAWAPAPGLYLVQVDVWDWANNPASCSMSVTVH